MGGPGARGTTLDALGPRICVLGPSNSGKSTLAQAIGRSRALAVVHLDLLYHRPHTDWEPRPEAEFLALHEQAIAGERWVIDGNYSRCLPQRLARATGLILLDVGTATSVLRYLRRTLFEGQTRAGALAGGRDSLKWSMLRHIAGPTRANRRRYAREFALIDKPKLRLASRRAVAQFYAAERLPDPAARAGEAVPR